MPRAVQSRHPLPLAPPLTRSHLHLWDDFLEVCTLSDNLCEVCAVDRMGPVPFLVRLDGRLELQLLLLRGTIHMDGNLLSELSVDILQATSPTMCQRNPTCALYSWHSLRLGAHEVHEYDMEEGRDYEYEEKLPGDLVKSDRSGNEEDEAGKIETHHAETGALRSDMGWELRIVSGECQKCELQERRTISET